MSVHAGDLPPTRAELLAGVATADGLLSLLTETIDAEVLAGAPRLRAIANYAVGCDNIDLAAAAARGIPVGVTPDVLTDATADLTLALLLAAARHLPQAAQAVRDGAWVTWDPQGWLGLELREARLAVVGFGRIGRAVAERAAAFGMTIEPVGRDDDLHAALTRADIVTLHCPLTDATHHLIDADALAAMRPTALLVNTARGADRRPGGADRARCATGRSPARRSTSPTRSRSRPATRCSARRTSSSCRTSARRRTPRVSG